MRDYLAAIRERVVVFDGGMGATLEQFDLSLEDDYRLPGRAHEALVLNRPDVIEGVHASMVEAGAEVVETDTFQASRLKLDEWGLGDAHARDQRQGRRDRPQGGRRGPLRRRLDRPDRATCPRPTTRRSARSRFRELVDGLRRAGRGPDRGRRRPASSSRPRRTSSRSRPRSSARARRSSRTGRAVPIQTLGLAAAQRRQDAARHRHRARADDARGARRSTSIGLNCSTGPEDMRDAIRFLGEYSPAARPLHPERRPARSRAPTARRSSPRSPSRWPTCSASSSSATACRSSAAAAARRPSTSRAIARALRRRDADRRRARRRAPPHVLDDRRDAARAGARARRSSASA